MSDKPSIDSIFCAAIEIASPDERRALVEQACGQDQDLKQQVERLLRAHFHGRSILDAPAQPVATVDESRHETAGTVLGPYKLLEQVGEGGMGTVWMAEQTEPIQRRVAIKVIKAGMASKQVLARFEAERQALALMEHPNIARVLDAGATDAGRPFFVMELVKGTPITRYCDDKHLSVRQRLELFGDVCRAVQHAHQKGIIHRDLKPNNILIAPFDGKPVVKVIDFGVAKATGQRLTDATLFTGFGAVVGTPQYMSPEQAETNNQDIDTRSDIYSLGVLLYELLTGSTPLTQKRVQEAALLEILRVIREEEPPRPSTRLSSTAELPAISAQRHTEPAKLTRLVRGELDWIVMKALDKDRNRRYETANALALDIQCFLRDEPVQACPPSVGYRLRKFARRHRGPVLAACLLLTTLLTGIVGTTWGLLVAEQAHQAEAEQRHKVEQERDAKEKARKEAEDNNRKALALAATEREAKQAEAAQRQQAEAIAKLLESVFLELDPDEAALHLQKELAGRLDQVAAKVAKESDVAPLVQARLRTAVGTAYLALGEYGKAAAQHEKALELYQLHQGPDDPLTLRSLERLAEAYRKGGQLEKALDLHRQLLEKREAQLGPEHYGTLVSMNNLALAYADTGQLHQAVPLFDQALPKAKKLLGPDHYFTIVLMNNLAGAYSRLRDYSKARPLAEQAYAAAERRLGPDHGQTLRAMDNLALLLVRTGDFQKGLPLLEEALNKMSTRFGPDHPLTLHALNNLGVAYLDAGHFVKAMAVLQQALEKAKDKFGPDHGHTLLCAHNLALAYFTTNQLQKARPLLEETLDRMMATLGPDHYLTTRTMNDLGVAYFTEKRVEKALPLLQKAVQKMRVQFRPDHPDTVRAMINLGTAYVFREEPGKARPLYEEVLAQYRSQLGPDHPETVQAMSRLAQVYCELGKLELAEKLLHEALPAARKHWPEQPSLAEILAELGRALCGQKKYLEAEPPLREALAIYAQKQPKTWEHFKTMSLLGGSLLGQKKYTEAEPLLLGGFEGLVNQRAKTDVYPQELNRVAEAARRVMDYYEALGKPAEATAWSKKLSQFYLTFAEFGMRVGRWGKVDAALGHYLEVDPSDYRVWQRAAVVKLYLGDVEGYHRACREMLARCQTEMPGPASAVARTCMLTADATAADKRVQHLVELAVSDDKHPLYPKVLLTKGVAEYRAGHFAAAVEILMKCAARADGDVFDALVFTVRAMAEQQLGKTDLAHSALASAQAIIAARMPDPAQGREFTVDSWQQWLHCQILYREAEKLTKKETSGR
jgi:serine/threonine protein kinase/tetratricopeptide (TPR) repeat protein